MITLLRIIGLFNAAIWLGSAVFLTVGAAPAFFSDEMRALLGVSYPVYSGALVQVMFKRFFLVQYICSAVALTHMLGEYVYLGRPLDRLATGFVAFLLLLSLLGGKFMQPKLQSLHLIKYGVGPTVEQKELAAHSLRLWHGISQTANLFVLVALIGYYWRVVNRPEPLKVLGRYK